MVYLSKYKQTRDSANRGRGNGRRNSTTSDARLSPAEAARELEIVNREIAENEQRLRVARQELADLRAMQQGQGQATSGQSVYGGGGNLPQRPQSSSSVYGGGGNLPQRPQSSSSVYGGGGNFPPQRPASSWVYGGGNNFPQFLVASTSGGGGRVNQLPFFPPHRSLPNPNSSGIFFTSHQQGVRIVSATPQPTHNAVPYGTAVREANVGGNQGGTSRPTLLYPSGITFVSSPPGIDPLFFATVMTRIALGINRMLHFVSHHPMLSRVGGFEAVLSRLSNTHINDAYLRDLGLWLMNPDLLYESAPSQPPPQQQQQPPHPSPPAEAAHGGDNIQAPVNQSSSVASGSSRSASAGHSTTATTPEAGSSNLGCSQTIGEQLASQFPDLFEATQSAKVDKSGDERDSSDAAGVLQIKQEDEDDDDDDAGTIEPRIKRRPLGDANDDGVSGNSSGAGFPRKE